jgi:hypothetical protein
MYIVLESLSEIDPRCVPELKYLEQYKHWEFEICYIDPADVSKVPLDQIAHRVVTEEVARACKFASADHTDRLGIVEGSEIHQELIHASMEPHSYKPKVYYTMTDADKENALKFLKIEMQIFLEKHYRDNLTAEERNANATYRQQLESEINNLSDINSAKRMIHEKFGTWISSVLAEEEQWGPAELQLTQ